MSVWLKYTSGRISPRQALAGVIGERGGSMSQSSTITIGVTSWTTALAHGTDSLERGAAAPKTTPVIVM
jgi:hypothetical protein